MTNVAHVCAKKVEEIMKATIQRLTEEAGAIGYILMWALGVPASLLFVIFLMRGCT
jgi:hypothetical protein